MHDMMYKLVEGCVSKKEREKKMYEEGRAGRPQQPAEAWSALQAKEYIYISDRASVHSTFQSKKLV